MIQRLEIYLLFKNLWKRVTVITEKGSHIPGQILIAVGPWLYLCVTCYDKIMHYMSISHFCFSHAALKWHTANMWTGVI